MKLWSLNQITNEEKQNILSQHREIYDGFKTMQGKIQNPQPLYVQDFAKDKAGAVMSNKGNVKAYTNVGINEEKEELNCSECGGMMKEGECSECGWKGEVGAEGEMRESKKEMCSECGGMMKEGECADCGYKMEETKEGIYKTGKLSDIYNVEDLGDDEFDYVEGGGNKYGTFEKMHHMREQHEIDEIGVSKLKKGKKYKYDTPGFEDEVEFADEFEDKSGGEKMYKFKGKGKNTHMVSKAFIEKFIKDLKEQGRTGGGSSPDTSISNIKSAYDFKSNGPIDAYPTEGELDEYDFNSYEPMESAWSDDELEEANDISGVQGVYGDMEPAYDFDSEGPGSAGPYQRSSWGGTADDEGLEGELELDLDKFNPMDKSWEEIAAHTGEDEFAHLVDEDIQESFLNQKNKIQEMFKRMNVIK